MVKNHLKRDNVITPPKTVYLLIRRELPIPKKSAKVRLWQYPIPLKCYINLAVLIIFGIGYSVDQLFETERTSKAKKSSHTFRFSLFRVAEESLNNFPRFSATRCDFSD